MTIKNVGGTDPVPVYLKPAYGKAPKPFIIANTDTANPVYYSDELTITTGSSVIDPQATVGFDGTRDVYMSTLRPGVQVLVDHIPGGTQWSNPVGVQIALNALGLAKDTSVNAPAYGPVTTVNPGLMARDTSVNAPAFGPAKDTTVAAVKTSTDAVKTTLGTPAQSADVAGTTTAVGALHAGQPIATEISQQGTLLLSSATSLLNLGTTVIAASGSNTQGPLSIKQIGYEIFVAVTSASASAIPFVKAQLTWTDSVTGNTVAAETWYLAGRSTGAFNTYIGTGPTKGDTLSITFTNLDTANAASVQCSFAGNSRVYVRDDWRSLSFGSVPGFTNATNDPASNFLMSTSPGVPGSGSLLRLIPLYAGLVNITVVGPASGTAQAIVAAIGPQGLATGVVYESPFVSANGVLNAQISLPRSICQVTLFNTAATNQTISFTAVIAEQLA